MKTKILAIAIVLGTGVLVWAVMNSAENPKSAQNKPQTVWVDSMIIGEVQSYQDGVLTFTVGSKEMKAKVNSDTTITRIDNVMGKSTTTAGTTADLTKKSTATIYYKVEKASPTDRPIGLFQSNRIEVRP
jgi:hypothetical protein